MKRLIKQTKGYLTNVGPEIKVRRVLPSVEIREMNPFFFLDVMKPLHFEPNSAPEPEGTGAHPHRGFVTFTYLMSGEVEHRDSYGHKGVVSAGGGQWMKAGSGIIHDERPTSAFLQRGGIQQGFQLWINLPKAHKEDKPAYMPLLSEEIPELALDGGLMRILIGSYGGQTSKIPTYTPMALYHIRLDAGQSIKLDIPHDWDTSVYIESGKLQFADTIIEGPKLGLLSTGGDFVAENLTDETADFFVFTGQRLEEPIAAHGPFVMNDEPGLVRAYNDFYAGKYGDIDYSL